MTTHMQANRPAVCHVCGNTDYPHYAMTVGQDNKVRCPEHDGTGVYICCDLSPASHTLGCAG